MLHKATSIPLLDASTFPLNLTPYTKYFTNNVYLFFIIIMCLTSLTKVNIQGVDIEILDS